MNKTVELRVSISTNPATAHIGRYLVDMRDTTNGADRQMWAKVTNDPAAFAAIVTGEGLKAGVLVTTIDNTGE